MTRVAYIVLTLAALVLSQQTATSDELDQQLRRAVELQRQGQFSEAAEAYEAVLSLSEQRSPRVLAALGSLYLRLGRAPEAAERLLEALRLDPALTAARMPLALSYLQSGDAASAAAEAAKLVESDPSDAKAYHLLGLCRLKMGQFEDGAAALEESLLLSSADNSAAYTLATAYASQGRVADAERVQRRRLAGVDTPENLLVSAAIHKARGDYPKAIETLEQALRRKPGLPTANEMLGRALVGLSRLPEAEKAYARELLIDPMNFNANAVLGWIRLRDKRYQAAAPVLDAAARQSPNDPGVLFMRAQIDVAGEAFEEAARKLEQVVEQRPDDRAAHVLLARAYAKLKRLDAFRREREIIRTLTGQEQERNLLRERSYRGPSPMPIGEP